jgi:hypothetical protein
MKNSLSLILILWFCLGVNCAFAGEMPLIDLSKNKWKLGKGMSIQDGILTIQGNPEEYRKATLTIPVKELPKKKFFVKALIKTKNVKQGERSYQLPKIKAYIKNKEEDTRKAARIQAETLSDWTPHALSYQLPATRPNEKLVIELSAEKCYGTVMFKDIELSEKVPQNVQRFPFPVPQKPVCVLNIDTSETKKFNNNLLGLNSHFMGYDKLLSYKDKRVQDIIGKIRVPLMRFPGGTVSNWYNYETDMWEVLPNTETSSKILKRMGIALTEGRKFGFDEYLELSEKYGFNSTLVLNVLHDSPERSAARLMDRKKRGLKFSWVELGNENYAKAQQCKDIKNVNTYIEKCKLVTAEIKKVSPESIVAVNISAANDKTWGIPISKENFYDAVVMHPYSHAGKGSPAFTPMTMLEGFTAYAQIARELDEYEKIYGQKPLLLTEWGVIGGDKAIRNHMASLGTADMFFKIIEKSENGPVKNACLHVLSDGYMGMYGSDSKEKKVFKRGYGVMYDLMVNAFLNNELVKSDSTSPMLTNEQHAIMARVARTKDGQIKIFAVNLYPVDSTLDLVFDKKPYKGKYKIEAFSEKNLYEQKRYGIDENPCIIKEGENAIILPPYSISLITLPIGS